jgi:hypothetical protein
LTSFNDSLFLQNGSKSWWWVSAHCFEEGPLSKGYQRANIPKFIPSGKDWGVGAACWQLDFRIQLDTCPITWWWYDFLRGWLSTLCKALILSRDKPFSGWSISLPLSFGKWSKGPSTRADNRIFGFDWMDDLQRGGNDHSFGDNQHHTC